MLKNEKIKEIPIKKSEKSHTMNFCRKKISLFQQMITNTILAVQKYKTMDIISASDMNICMQNLETLYKQLNVIDEKLNFGAKNRNFDEIITLLQKINNELSALFRTTGTQYITDLIMVAMGSDFLKSVDENDCTRSVEVIKEYVHPISYIVLPWRGKKGRHYGSAKNKKQAIAKNRIVEDFMIVETSTNFDCFDLARTSKQFQKKVYGIKVSVHNDVERKTLIISGVVDDILIECTNHMFLKNKRLSLFENKPKDPYFQGVEFERFVETLTIKEILVYKENELYQRFTGYINQTQLIKQKPISQNVKEFLGSGLYGQRRILIQLLIKYDDPEFQYLAYLLYDLLSNDSNGSIDTIEQTVLFDSLPWNIKRFFRDAMRTTMNYTKALSNFDNNKIPIEQQICLLKTADNVKEKAMVKLKEVKAKSEDSGSKARQYLEGLLKIPFGIYRTEPILLLMGEIKDKFRKCAKKIRESNIDIKLPPHESCSSLEIRKHFKDIEDHALNKMLDSNLQKLRTLFCEGKRDILVANTCFINGVIKNLSLDHPRLCHSGKKNGYMRENIRSFIIANKDNSTIIQALHGRFPKMFNVDLYKELDSDINAIRTEWIKVNLAIETISNRLEDAVHGHKTAKRQLQRIIGQWINGEQKGYCFGFEGPPGIGKTTLAKKGLTQCLADDRGGYRPFAFIPIGGSSNGSTLSGHNYTYVGSTWGRIVDILMEKKCMNPIIFIDELDKVSRSEHGKEIIGILTHLVDESQNESFQDKYFTGIDLDLSRALFIFSYNDASLIDKILLDRIHRIKFDSLSIEEKRTITKKYLLPEIYKKVGLNKCIEFTDEIITFIIDTYTSEPGVRKLKEILFEIISEVNLEILQSGTDALNLPSVMTKDLIINKFLKDRREITFAKIHAVPTTGLVIGLWANALGKGGIIPIEGMYFLANNPLDLKLTGLQGNVMKESMNVAKSLAWKLTNSCIQKKLAKTFSSTKLQGVHIHCPEGATPKDGPSAGTAITVAIYSLFNNKAVRHDVAITGEINLQGKVSMIGGLKLKILGGVKAGVKTFIYPEENNQDFKKFMKKYEDKPVVEGITFHSVKDIRDVLKLVFIE